MGVGKGDPVERKLAGDRELVEALEAAGVNEWLFFEAQGTESTGTRSRCYGAGKVIGYMVETTIRHHRDDPDIPEGTFRMYFRKIGKRTS